MNILSVCAEKALLSFQGEKNVRTLDNRGQSSI